MRAQKTSSIYRLNVIDSIELIIINIDGNRNIEIRWRKEKERNTLESTLKSRNHLFHYRAIKPF